MRLPVVSTLYINDLLSNLHQFAKLPKSESNDGSLKVYQVITKISFTSTSIQWNIPGWVHGPERFNKIVSYRGIRRLQITSTSIGMKLLFF